MKNNKGITLVALIITVIIMLILIAVSINVVIKSNILNSAKNAGKKTADEIEREANLGEVTIDGKTYASISDYIDGKEKIQPGQRASQNAEYTIGGKTAIIPEGFTLSGYKGNGEAGSDETTIDGGLVIYDIPAGVAIDWTSETQVNTARTTYNQFVWIPVEFTKAAGETYETANKNFDTVWVRSAWSNNARVSEPTSTSIPNSTNWSNYTEPYSYEVSGINADYDGNGAGKTGIAAELEAMRASVYKYGGFYIARYEAGTDVIRESTSKSTVSPLKFVQDAYPYNYVAWGDPSKTGLANNYSMRYVGNVGAVYLSRNIEFKSGSTKVTSMLCSSVAWDAMLDFVKDTEHDVTSSSNWGNYSSATFTVDRQAAIDWKGSSLTENNGTYTKPASSVLLTTGASERNKAKNLYDIAGNCIEWTTEALNSNCRVLRRRLLQLQWLWHSSILPLLRLSLQ